MAASGDVTITQDGGQGSVKAHPYLVALVRWCVSCLWSTATVLLHRLLAGYTLRPSITASKPAAKPRAAGTEHLHPEPKVECRVLHQPLRHQLDVVFVHGLYGSLGNTWRQGDWRSKYKLGPNKVPLLRPSSCTCLNEADRKNEANIYEANMNEAYRNIDEKFTSFKKILPKDEVFITEKFFDHTVLDQVEILDNFETQAQFVRDLFENENRRCENDSANCDEGKIDLELNEVNCECRVNEVRKCQVGCGCVCDECYSSCWPRDWIKEDYPEARVISINYTSDPYLWRPLWIKECKRLRLHERAEQMTKQLLELGVGDRPVIWVGHSKGGLFIKQIYCEAYEAHLKLREDQNRTTELILRDADNNSSFINYENNNKSSSNDGSNNFNSVISVNNDNNHNDDGIESGNDSDREVNGHFSEDNAKCDADVEFGEKSNTLVKIDEGNIEEDLDQSSNNEEDNAHMERQAALWARSGGFMFYSVPHRGSPLAGIKTPLTARSIELLEISKDCELVLSLQDRWLKATEARRPQVRSLVETCRTLMSVLWLRIVSVPSADAGIGALYGVSVDHREICKPSSRQCLLYQELMSLMRAALNQCRCEP